MTARNLMAFGTVTIAALAATPALAGPDMSYETRTYEYAQPAPPAASEVIYRQEPVVQPLPAPMPAPVAAPQPVYEQDYAYEEEYEYKTAAPAPMAHHPMPHHPMPHAMHRPHHPQAAAYPPPYPDFDRAAWLDDCESKVRGKDSKKKGGIIGALLGAIAGGVIGNRAWKSERLGATLIGAGAGGLVGGVIGSAIGGKGRGDRDYCEAYLDRYLMGSYGQSGYGYGYGYTGYTMVPVMVAVPQRAVVREYVTEEWVDVPVKHKPVKKVRYIKQAPTKAIPVKTKTIKYSKGN